MRRVGLHGASVQITVIGEDSPSLGSAHFSNKCCFTIAWLIWWWSCQQAHNRNGMCIMSFFVCHWQQFMPNRSSRHMRDLSFVNYINSCKEMIHMWVFLTDEVGTVANSVSEHTCATLGGGAMSGRDSRDLNKCASTIMHSLAQLCNK